MISTATRRRAVLSFLDQSVSSISNFATGVVIAQFSGAVEFGHYMLVLVIWLLLVGIHRALLTEPVIITSRVSDDPKRVVSEALTADLLVASAFCLVVAALGGVGVVAGVPFARLVVLTTPWFLPLLLQDFWRAMAFRERRPGAALANDLFFAFVQALTIALFWLLGWKSAGHIIAAWGTGAAAGAILGFVSFRAISPVRDGTVLLRQLWPLSRLMLADFLTSFSANQAYLFFAALFLSQTDYGGFRAAFSLMGPTVVILHAGANFGLPEAASRRDTGPQYNLRPFARRLSIATCIVVGLYGLFVAAAGERLLGLVYGAEFARYAPLAALAAIQHVVAVSVFGQEVLLKATGRVQRLWRARLLAAVASLSSMAFLILWRGTIGAGLAGVATALYYVGALYAVYAAEVLRPESTDSAVGTLLGRPPASSENP